MEFQTPKGGDGGRNVKFRVRLWASKGEEKMKESIVSANIEGVNETGTIPVRVDLVGII